MSIEPKTQINSLVSLQRQIRSNQEVLRKKQKIVREQEEKNEQDRRMLDKQIKINKNKAEELIQEEVRIMNKSVDVESLDKREKELNGLSESLKYRRNRLDKKYNEFEAEQKEWIEVKANQAKNLERMNKSIKRGQKIVGDTRNTISELEKEKNKLLLEIKEGKNGLIELEIGWDELNKARDEFDNNK